MPNIMFEAATLPKEKKDELIRGLTGTASGITGIPETAFQVLIRETPVENWGIGGVPLEEILQRTDH